MKEIKFTSDGKKVVVIGSLNTKSKIVQEIFVDGSGNEIPSGENFVVTSLHDAPLVSWKEKRKKDVEESYEVAVKGYERQMSELKKRMKPKVEFLRKSIEKNGEILNNISPDSFKMICDFLEGKMKFMVEDSYEPKIIDLDEGRKLMYDNSIKLMSIYGRDDGSLQYRLNDYGDYSGGARWVFLFETREEAFDKFKEVIRKKTISTSIIDLAFKYGIDLDEEKLREFKERQIIKLSENIQSHMREIERWGEMIKEYKNDDFNRVFNLPFVDKNIAVRKRE